MDQTLTEQLLDPILEVSDLEHPIEALGVQDPASDTLLGFLQQMGLGIIFGFIAVLAAFNVFEFGRVD